MYIQPVGTEQLQFSAQMYKNDIKKVFAYTNKNGYKMEDVVPQLYTLLEHAKNNLAGKVLKFEKPGNYYTALLLDGERIDVTDGWIWSMLRRNLVDFGKLPRYNGHNQAEQYLRKRYPAPTPVRMSQAEFETKWKKNLGLVTKEDVLKLAYDA